MEMANLPYGAALLAAAFVAEEVETGRRAPIKWFD